MMDTVMKNEAFTLNINKMFELSEWKGAKDIKINVIVLLSIIYQYL